MLKIWKVRYEINLSLFGNAEKPQIRSPWDSDSPVTARLFKSPGLEQRGFSAFPFFPTPSMCNSQFPLGVLDRIHLPAPCRQQTIPRPPTNHPILSTPTHPILCPSCKPKAEAHPQSHEERRTVPTASNSVSSGPPNGSTGDPTDGSGDSPPTTGTIPF